MFGHHKKNPDQNRVIQRLTEENRHLQADVQHLRQINAQFYHDNKILETNQKKLQEKIRQMEKSYDKAVKDFTHNSRDNIMATLKYDIERLQDDKDERDKEIAKEKREVDVLRTSRPIDEAENTSDFVERPDPVIPNKLTVRVKQFSVAGDSSDFVGTYDPYSPTRLTEMFSDLYDCKWTDAFEKSANIGSENEIATYLLNMFEAVWKFCKDNAEKQLEHLEKAFMIQMDSSTDGESFEPPPECINGFKDARIQLAKSMIQILNQKFRSTNKNVNEEVQPYVEGCMELCWLSALTDPPLHYVFDATGQDENFRVHTKSGTIVDYIVLPAMYQYKYGPLMNKGVAQYRD